MLGLGRAEVAVDQGEDPPGLVVDVFRGEPPARGLGEALVAEQLGERADVGQRRAQIVGGDGQKPASLGVETRQLVVERVEILPLGEVAAVARLAKPADGEQGGEREPEIGVDAQQIRDGEVGQHEMIQEREAGNRRDQGGDEPRKKHRDGQRGRHQAEVDRSEEHDGEVGLGIAALMLPRKEPQAPGGEYGGKDVKGVAVADERAVERGAEDKQERRGEHREAPELHSPGDVGVQGVGSQLQDAGQGG